MSWIEFLRLIKQFQLKSKIFHLDYAHRPGNTHPATTKKIKTRKKRTEYHMCTTPNRLVYFRLSKAKRSQKLARSNCISCHLAEIAWLPAPAPATTSGSCPAYTYGCVHVFGSPVPSIHSPDPMYGPKLPGCLGRLARMCETCKVTCMSARTSVAEYVVWEWCPLGVPCVSPWAGETPAPKPAINWAQLLLHDIWCQNMNSKPKN